MRKGWILLGAVGLIGCATQTTPAKKPVAIAGHEEGRQYSLLASDTVAATVPTTEEAEPAAIVESILGKPTSSEDLLWTYVYPRDDIDVLMDGYPVPTKAGMQTEVHFFKCPCGRLLLTGQYFLIDYETNDVIDELRKANIKIVSVAPAFLDSKPAMTILRFQAEGEASELANAIKASMQWIGEARNAHPKLEDLVPKE